VVMSDEYRPRMVKPRGPEPGVWKVNQRRWTSPRVTPTSDTLIEKYIRQRRKCVFQRLWGAREKGPLNGKSFTGDSNGKGQADGSGGRVILIYSEHT
jgi:hypothetical protein